jgi:hypothetical protein
MIPINLSHPNHETASSLRSSQRQKREGSSLVSPSKSEIPHHFVVRNDERGGCLSQAVRSSLSFSKFLIEVFPPVVKGVDERDFLRSRTTFNLFLPENRFPGIIENLKVYQFHHVIFRGEPGDHFGFVFPDSPLQITGYPSIIKWSLVEASALKKGDLWELRDCFGEADLAVTTLGWDYFGVDARCAVMYQEFIYGGSRRGRRGAGFAGGAVPVPGFFWEFSWGKCDSKERVVGVTGSGV